MSNYMQYQQFDVANGKGVRSSVFFSGCSLRCLGCWNPKSWNPKNGEPFTQQTIDEVLKGLEHEAISGLSILGGEPFENLDGTVALASQFREKFGDSKNIWVWSGYSLSQILEDSEKLELLKLADVLVEGRFVLAQRNLSLQFRGSTNQRVLDVRQTLQSGEGVWLEGITQNGQTVKP